MQFLKHCKKWFNFGPALAGVVFLASCSVVPRYESGAYTNAIASRPNDNQSRASFPKCTQNRNEESFFGECDQRLFVGVAISGGGSRAANFALSALWQLQELGLLQETTAISSVSGGSLAASYVSLFGLDSASSFENAAVVLRQNFLAGWIWRSINPYQLLRTNFTNGTATQTLAKTFDDLVFHEKRFKDLGSFRPGHPYLYINAGLQNPVSARLHVGTRGENAPSGDLQGFTFTSTAFDAIGSDLSSYRIADAVAASGAYPALFEPMVLKNYQDVALPGDPQAKFLHLSDGGTADNLGVDALIRSAEELNAHSLSVGDSKNKACLFIIIDAAVRDPGMNAGAMSDLREGFVDSILSSSINRAFDSLLERRRQDELSALGINEAADDPIRFNPSASISLGNYRYVDGGTYKLTQRGVGQPLEVLNATATLHTTMTCAVWHISFDHLQEIATGRSKFQQQNFGPWDPPNSKPHPGRALELEKLDYFVNSVETNYHLKLTGKSTCSPETIQTALFDAARVLVRDDTDIHTQLSNWLRSHGLPILANSILDSELTEKPVDTAPSYTLKSVNAAKIRLNCN